MRTNGSGSIILMKEAKLKYNECVLQDGLEGVFYVGLLEYGNIKGR